MRFVDACAHNFDGSVRKRGNAYFHEDRTEIVEQKPSYAKVFVQGDTANYEVEVDWRDIRNGVLDVSCTCPYYDDHGPCKHIWAAGLELDASGLLARVTAPRGPIHFAAEPAEVETPPASSRGLATVPSQAKAATLRALIDASDNPRMRAALGKTLTALTPKPELTPRPAPVSRWKQVLTQLEKNPAAGESLAIIADAPAKQREVRYLVDRENTKRLGLTLLMQQRETKKNGEFGKWKSLKIDLLNLRLWADHPDLPLLRGLLAYDQSRQHYELNGHQYYGGNQYVERVLLPADAHEFLLPQLCQTGRFGWTKQNLTDDELDIHWLRWDDGPPYQFRLRITVDNSKKQWSLKGELYRDGVADILPLETPVMLSSEGFAMLPEMMARLDARSHFTWVVNMRQQNELTVPFSQRHEFMEHLWRSPELPPLILPEELRVREVRLPPAGYLRIERSKFYDYQGMLYALVLFSYGGKQFSAKDRLRGVYNADDNTALVRDAAAERQLLEHLFAAGLRPIQHAYKHPGGDLEFNAKTLPAIVNQLTAAGWTVEAEGGVFRRAGEFKLSVISSVDWFGLEGEFDFDGQKVRLPEILAAIRRGDKYLKLGDGTQGVLPEEWLAKFGALAEMGQVQEGEVRFKPTQALLLDALLASQPDVQIDAKFAAYRKKLQAFKGVTPSQEPDGFQGQLRDYQREGLGWLGFLREFGFGGCLADDMGLGKTIQVLALLQSRAQERAKNKQPHKPSLVVVPRSLVFNWMQEAAKFTPNLRMLDFSLPTRTTLADPFQERDVVLTTYGTLLRDILKLKDVEFDYVILDESQAIKNAQSQSAKSCRLLQADHRLTLTGTPIENHLGELWSMFEFLNPGMLGHSAAFQRFSGAAKEGPPEESLQMLSRAIAPFVLRRTKEQVLTELPEKTEQTIYCDLSTKERKHYDELRDFYRASLANRVETDGLAKSKIHVLEALLRLRQASCHLGLLDKSKSKETSAKLTTLLEQLEEIVAEGHKALVFSQFTSLLEIVKGHLDKQKLVYEYLDGKTRDRQARVDRFQTDPKCPVFLISLKAGGRGLNLTAADYVFILDPWWNPAVEAQAVDRAHRLGQTRRVFSYRLIARDTVEEKILELKKSKQDLADAIISAEGGMLKQLTADDLRLLLS